MFVLRDIAILAAGIFVGFTLATMLVYPQLDNRYRMGQASGFNSGAFRVIGFLRQQFPENKDDLPRQPVAHLDIKHTRIEIIEKNGVRTLQIK